MTSIPPLPPEFLWDDPGPLSPYEILRGRIDAVLAEWRALIAREPWAGLSPSRLMNGLPEILPPLLREAERGATRVSPELAEQITEAHGQYRRDDGVPLAALAEEWNYVKRACWKVMQREHVDPATMSAVLQRLDVLIDDAIGFTLRGYYAEELEALRGKGLERRGDEEDRRVNPPERRGPE
jgi:hypothetical protein